MPKVDISVIVPVYNTEKHIRDCIESIISQTKQSIEVILINGGSSDNTGNICNEYAKIDKRIKVIHKADNGVTSDRKAGLKIATGDYITFVDGDDWISENMYDELFREAENSGADIVTSGVIREYPNSNKIILDGLDEGVYDCRAEGALQQNMIWIGESRKKGIVPGLWNKLFRRNVIYDAYMSMDDLITHNEDEAAFIAAVLDAQKVSVLHKAFYHYRAWEGASSNKQDELFFERFNRWMLYLRQTLSKCKHAEKLERDIDKLALDQIVWGMETQFQFIGKNAFPRYVIPKTELPEGDIVLYGAGLVGRSFYKQLIGSAGHRIVGWIDKGADIYADEVKSVETIKELEYDMVVIAVKDKGIADQIKIKLIEMGVNAEKISWFDPIYILDYIFD